MSGDSLDELIRRIPELLKAHPELAEKLYAVLKDRFVTNETLKAYMEQSERRFEASEKRLEALRTDTDRRFEELLTQMDRRFEASDKRFEASDKRFEELLAQMDRRFEEAKQERLVIQAGLGALGWRSGIALERTILNVFRRVLELRGIDVDKVEKVGIRDELGEFYSPGAKVEYDLYVHNGEHILFEIKYHVKAADIENFLRKAKFFEQKKKVRTKKTVIALEIDEQVKQLCGDRGVEVITS